MPEPTRLSERTIKGLPASNGVARGKLFVLGRSDAVTLPEYSIGPDEVTREQERFKQAIVTTRGQLGAIQERLQTTLGNKDAELFDAQLLFLDDPTVVSQVMRQIESRLCNAETALAHEQLTPNRSRRIQGARDFASRAPRVEWGKGFCRANLLV